MFPILIDQYANMSNNTGEIMQLLTRVIGLFYNEKPTFHYQILSNIQEWIIYLKLNKIKQEQGPREAARPPLARRGVAGSHASPLLRAHLFQNVRCR